MTRFSEVCNKENSPTIIVFSCEFFRGVSTDGALKRSNSSIETVAIISSNSKMIDLIANFKKKKNTRNEVSKISLHTTFFYGRAPTKFRFRRDRLIFSRTNKFWISSNQACVFVPHWEKEMKVERIDRSRLILRNMIVLLLITRNSIHARENRSVALIKRDLI